MKTYKITTPGYTSYEKQFKNDDEMFGYLVGCDDDSRSWAEKLINGVWHYWSLEVQDWVSPKGVFKRVCFAYQTSESAKDNGMENSGCWLIELVYDGKIKTFGHGHRLFTSALHEAACVSMPWESFFISYYKNAPAMLSNAISQDVDSCLNLQKQGKTMAQAVALINQERVGQAIN